MIAAAVVCFILFVSAQALRDWPISDLNFPGGGNDSAAVAPAKSLGGSSTNAAAANLNGPVTANPARVGAAAKAGGGNGGTASHRHHATGKVSPETQIQGGRGVDSAPVKQPSSSAPTPAPAPTTGSTPPAGSGTASPSPSGGNGSAPAGGNSGNSGGNTNSGNPPASSNVGTRTARRVTNTVKEIASAATPPAPTPVTHAVQEVEERVAPTPPPAGSTSEKVAEVVGKIGK